MEAFEVKIQNDVKLPPARRGNAGRPGVYSFLPWDDLKVGQGFSVPKDKMEYRDSVTAKGTRKVAKLASAANSAGKRLGRKFGCRVDDKGNGIVVRRS